MSGVGNSLRTQNSGESPAERLRQVEVRLQIAERSNQALLQELVKTQNELRKKIQSAVPERNVRWNHNALQLKAEVRRTEELLRNEQATRSHVEGAVRSNTELLNQYSSRLQRNDEQLGESRAAISNLVSQLRGIEQASLQGSYSSASKNDIVAGKVNQLSSQMEENLQARNQLERTVFQLANEVQQLRGRYEAQAAEVAHVSKEIKTRSVKLEQENRLAVDTIRRQSESNVLTEQFTVQLKNQIEQRLVELRDAIVDVRGQQERDKQEVRTMSQQVAARLVEHQSSSAENGRRRDEMLHALELAQKERERLTDADFARLNAQLLDVSEEASRRLAQSEMKQREENSEKFALLEKLVVEDRDARKKFEKTAREDSEQMWIAFKKLFDDEMKRLRDAHATDYKKSKNNVNKLNEAIELIERHMEEQKKHTERLMAAEITSRQQQERQFGSRLNDIEEKLTTSNRSLKDTVSILSSKLQADSQSHEVLLADLSSKQANQTRTLEDLETQIRALTAVAENSDKFDILRLEIDSRVAAEAEARKHDIDNLQVQLVKRTEADSRDRDQTQTRLLELQDSVNQLSETLESLKSSLSAKIQSEERQRVRDVQHLQDEVDELRARAGDRSRQGEIQQLQDEINQMRDRISALQRQQNDSARRPSTYTNRSPPHYESAQPDDNEQGQEQEEEEEEE